MSRVVFKILWSSGQIFAVDGGGDFL